MCGKQIYHLNDRTMKYMSLAQTKRQHQYLGLPGEFKTRFPQEIVISDMEYGRIDECYLNDEGLLINLEEESEKVNNNTFEKFSKYVIFGSFMYSKRVYLGVICHINPQKDHDYYEFSPSLIIKVHYFYFSQNELWVKYENIINKVRQRQELSDMEALDMAFISKFVSKKDAPTVIDSLTKIFKETIIKDKRLKLDVGVIIGGMVLKYFKSIKEQNKLMGRLNMKVFENEIEKLVYDEYGDELEAKDRIIEDNEKELESKDRIIEDNEKELESKDNKINEFKNKIEQLNNMEDLNTSEAKKIIDSLMLL